jgi:hypothetical protein
MRFLLKMGCKIWHRFCDGGHRCSHGMLDTVKTLRICIFREQQMH